MNATTKNKSNEPTQSEQNADQLSVSENPTEETREETNKRPADTVTAQSEENGKLVPFEPKPVQLRAPDAIHLARQLADTVPSPVGSIDSEVKRAIHESLRLYEGLNPEDAHESILARLAVAATNAAMEASARGTISAGVPWVHEKHMRNFVKTALVSVKLLDAIDRHRGRQQTVNIRDVNVQAGGQAIVGNVNKPVGENDPSKPKALPKSGSDEGGEK